MFIAFFIVFGTPSSSSKPYPNTRKCILYFLYSPFNDLYLFSNYKAIIL